MDAVFRAVAELTRRSLLDELFALVRANPDRAPGQLLTMAFGVHAA